MAGLGHELDKFLADGDMCGVFGIGLEPFGVVMRGHEDHVDRHGAGREEVIGHFKGLEGRNLAYEGFETLLDELGVFGGGTAFSFGFQRPPDDVTNHDATPFEQRLNQRRTWDAHAA